MTNRKTIHESEANDTSVGALDEAIAHIRQALIGLKFGTLAIIVQDGVVIQLERTERRRLRKSDRG